MVANHESFERESRIYPARAYKEIVTRVEKIVPPNAVNLPELVGQSGKSFTVIQITKSKEQGDSLDVKEIIFGTGTERWTLNKGTGTDHESLTDRLTYSKTEDEEKVEFGMWDHSGSERYNRINVNVFMKFDELLKDLEAPEESGTTETS